MDKCKHLPTACLPPKPMIKIALNTGKTVKTYPEYRGYRVDAGRERGSNGKASPYPQRLRVWCFPVAMPVGRSVAFGAVGCALEPYSRPYS